MIIRKYLHSCLCIEANGKRLLIDPGSHSFIEKKIKPEDIDKVDVIVLTHSHGDHYDPEALKVLRELKPCTIVTHSELGERLAKEGLPYEKIESGETKMVEGFRIQAFDTMHGPIPTPTVPRNFSYLINERVFHPGDSFTVPADVKKCEILFLPIAGPWLTLVEAFAFARALEPKMVIPAHDVIIKDFFLERMYEMCDFVFEKERIRFVRLPLGETLEI